MKPMIALLLLFLCAACSDDTPAMCIDMGDASAAPDAPMLSPDGGIPDASNPPDADLPDRNEPPVEDRLEPFQACQLLRGAWNAVHFNHECGTTFDTAEEEPCPWTDPLLECDIDAVVTCVHNVGLAPSCDARSVQLNFPTCREACL